MFSLVLHCSPLGLRSLLDWASSSYGAHFNSDNILYMHNHVVYSQFVVGHVEISVAFSIIVSFG